MTDYPKYTGPQTGDVVTGRFDIQAGRPVVETASEQTTLTRRPPDIRPGDIVAISGQEAPDGFAPEETELLVRPPRRGETVSAPQLRALRARDDLNRAVRAFFQERDFIETETPNLVSSPGTDVYLEAFRTWFTGMGPHQPTDLYLHTSPEFAMKRLLVAGMERIFQICKVYRNGEWTPAHNPEFSMVEWYRAFADYEAIMDDVEALVRRAVGREALTWKGEQVDLDEPFERLTVREAFERYCQIDILELNTAEALRRAAAEQNLGRLSPEGSWDDLFHQLLITHIEPRLGGGRPTLLMDYPRPLAVLAREKDDDPRLAERFELYIAGVELCNGFTELNDPAEQRRRFKEDLERREAMGLPAYPMPETFLEALEMGMPPSGGVALGLDRLLMLILGEEKIGDVLLRPVEKPTKNLSSREHSYPSR